MTQIVNALSDISAQYDALFVDLWGCVHNGVRAFDAANKALIDYRAGGGIVVLVTNSPRPAPKWNSNWPISALHAMHGTASLIRRQCTFCVVLGCCWSENLFHWYGCGTSFFEPLKLIDDPIQISHVPIEEAEGIVCTGLPTANGTPDDVRGPLLYAKQKGLKLLCANPDIIVDRGDKREWCAGAVAQAYSEMGGTSLYLGNPTHLSMIWRAVDCRPYAQTSLMIVFWRLGTGSQPISKAQLARESIVCLLRADCGTKKPPRQHSLILKNCRSMLLKNSWTRHIQLAFCAKSLFINCNTQ